MLIKESFTRDGRLKPGSDQQHSPDREARRIYAAALALVRAQGFDGVLRIKNYLTITVTDNVLSIMRDADHRTVLVAVAGDPPPCIVAFMGGAWSRLLQRDEL